MKLSKEFFYTLREDVSDEESTSGNLLVKAGYIKKVSNGIYMKLPLGIKVVQNVENIIKKHMDKIASQVIMPNLIPMDIFEKSGRAQVFGADMLKLQDRYNRVYALGPTDEEMFVQTAKPKIKSYKDLGFTIYQMGTKYRDEIRPRLGLIRTREFTMKDAYSFDKDYENLDKTYEKVFNAYIDIFNELGLDYVIVRADTGAMGGLLSEEFQALSDIGEDTVVLCDNCKFASNIEVCELVQEKDIQIEKKPIEKIETPNIKTIEELTKTLNIEKNECLKAIAYNIEGKIVIAFIRASRQINETKLQKILNVSELELATNEQLESARINPGFIGLDETILDKAEVIVDNNVKTMSNFVTGANEKDYHYINANLDDIKDKLHFADIVNVEQDDPCPVCGGKLKFKKSIEVGNTFKLGTKYSDSLDLYYLDENNKMQSVVMGSYGIGVERTVAAIVEQNHDEKGIIWPVNIAPYKVSIVVINIKDEKQMQIANKIYDDLLEKGIDIILDDRDQRVGVKFNDMDLIGVPYTIVVGKKINENTVELKQRLTGTSQDVLIDEIENKVLEILK